VYRDLSIIAKRSVESARIQEIILREGRELVESVALFDLFEEADRPPGKSPGFQDMLSIQRNHSGRQDINKLHESIVERIGKETGARLRRCSQTMQVLERKVFQDRRSQQDYRRRTLCAEVLGKRVSADPPCPCRHEPTNLSEERSGTDYGNQRLLYEEKLTIEGARQRLKQKKERTAVRMPA